MAIAQVDISRERLIHNLDRLRTLHPDGKVMAVVKANAYGHGLQEVAGILKGRVEAFFVDDLDELRQLRAVVSAPVLVGGYVPSADVEEAVSLDAMLVLYDEERLEAMQSAAEKLGKTARAHLKVDALLGRQGVLPNEAMALCERVRNFDKIRIEGVYAHFANIEDTTDPSHALAQTTVFDGVVKRMRAAGFREAQRHISSTSGAMVFESRAQQGDYVRLGVGLYGLYPSEDLSRAFAYLDLRPVMRWNTMLAQVKTLPADHPIGYGLTYITSKQTRIGIVPQGYSDGYDRGLSNHGEVLVHGKRCRVLGRVAMNMFAIDLSELPDAKAEDEVVLLGQQGGEQVTADEIAVTTGTINYEVVSRVSPLLPRAVV